MTNKEWLDYLAHNAPDELAAWFDAEHVENQELALDGDTAAQDGDSRDKLEADVRKIAEAYNMDTQRHGTERFAHELYYSIIHLLDRQAAITEREYGERMASEAMCSNVCAVVCEQRGRIAELQVKADELTAERDKLQEQLLIGWECECRLQAERDELKADHERIVQELVDANTRQCERTNELTAERDNWKANCEDWKNHAMAAENACYETMLEREDYRNKFGKCLDYADAIHALMDDEGVA